MSQSADDPSIHAAFTLDGVAVREGDLEAVEGVGHGLEDVTSRQSARGARSLGPDWGLDGARGDGGDAGAQVSTELAAVLGAERFVQEITTTANLQHPHILPLFDSGEADSFLYYVMPFIDGETLRDKLNRETQLGIEEAVKITTEIADALDYAHRHNVIHRGDGPLSP